MLKIFLVEDEFVVREGIKKNIDWAAHGYEFIGEAGDGELALPMIQKLKPDIVITDIRMPFMDGLTLSRLVKKELPDIEIIILSGFEEFEYAKEGINIGIAKYLSKPVSGEDLLKEIDEIALKIEEKNKEKEIRDRYVLEMQESIRREKSELFQSLVTGTKTVADLLEMSNKLEIDLSALWYNIVLIIASSTQHTAGEYSNSLIEIENRLEYLDKRKELIVFNRNVDGKAILIKADSREEILTLQEELTEEVKAVMADYPQVRFFGGIGIPVNRLRELPASYETASHAFAHGYLTEENRIFESAALTEKEPAKEETFNISDISPQQLDRRKMIGFLRRGSKEEVIYFVEEYFKNLGSSVMDSNMFRQYITMDIYFCVAEFLESLQADKKEIEAFDVSAGILRDRESAVNYIIHILTQAIEIRELSGSNRYGDIVEAVKEYIRDNYADEALSLNLLASHVNFSPNHLSMVFSQQTGQTISRYLTDYRMERAKELLKCTGRKSSQISMEVGYKDPHYFSYLFKKLQGMTPTQYREGRTAEEGQDEEKNHTDL